MVFPNSGDRELDWCNDSPEKIKMSDTNYNLEVLRSGHFTAEQLSRRTFCVNALKEFQQAGVKAWDALAEIKEKKLYWPHDSVKEFCREECGWTDERFYQLVRASKVRAALPPKTQQLLATESQARELSKVPEEKRVTVLKEAKLNGQITAKSIKLAADKVKRSEGIDDENGSDCVDVNGRRIHGEALAYWNRKTEVTEIINAIHSIKRKIEAIPKDDPLYATVGLSGVVGDLKSAINRLTGAVPAHLCPYCKGTIANCKACRGTGVVSKYFWDTAVPKEMKPEQPF